MSEVAVRTAHAPQQCTVHMPVCVCAHDGRGCGGTRPSNHQNRKTAPCVCSHTHEMKTHTPRCVCCTLLAKTTTNQQVYITSSVHRSGWLA